nr:SDR family NAD(P)-dependent oxidoreductase [Myxococcus guangdongensis]
MDPERLERTFRVNILAMFHLVRCALPHMKAGGTIINTASLQAYQPTPPRSTTPPRRAPSSPAPRAWRSTSSSAAFGSTPWRPALCGRR